jgi:membrane-associated phospholipid phosphatase
MLPARSSRLRPVEYVLLGYVTLSSVAAFTRAPRLPGCWWILVAHALVFLLVWLISRPNVGPVGRALREIYPMLLLMGFYTGLDVLSGGGMIPVHDATVQRWEVALFGGQVSREWWVAAPSHFWSFILHAAYLSYYVILLAPALFFALRRDFVSLRRFMLAVISTFVACYLFFIYLPVAGPYYAFPHPTGSFVDNFMARLVYGALASGSSYGAAFPSSHVAATISALLASWWGSRRLGLALLVPTVLLSISVVYCQMHYAVDALAGLLMGFLVSAVVWRVPPELSAVGGERRGG